VYRKDNQIYLPLLLGRDNEYSTLHLGDKGFVVEFLRLQITEAGCNLVMCTGPRLIDFKI
jgi:hypothetical protein